MCHMHTTYIHCSLYQHLHDLSTPFNNPTFTVLTFNPLQSLLLCSRHSSDYLPTKGLPRTEDHFIDIAYHHLFFAGFLCLGYPSWQTTLHIYLDLGLALRLASLLTIVAHGRDCSKCKTKYGERESRSLILCIVDLIMKIFHYLINEKMYIVLSVAVMARNLWQWLLYCAIKESFQFWFKISNTCQWVLW